MPTMLVNSAMSVGGVSINSSTTRTGDGLIQQQISLAAGKSGSLTTRTDNDTGVATLDSGHGIITNDVCDIYWSGGLRHGMTATVSGDAVTLDGGAGDNLPTQSTAVVVCKQTTVDIDFVGNNVLAIGVKSTGKLGCDFKSSAPASLLKLNLPANEIFFWISDQDITNPLAGVTVASASISNGSTDAAVVDMLVLYDSTS